MIRFISFVLIVTGCILLIFAGYLSWQRINPWRLSFSQLPKQSNEIISGNKLPQKIVIKRLNIRLPVYPAKIEKNNWQMSNSGVSYLLTSAIPGDHGNAILYGHNWNNLLADLPLTQLGDTIEIHFANNLKKVFVVESTAIISPSQYDVLKNTADSRVTLYTCTGFLDSKRFVVVGKLL